MKGWSNHGGSELPQLDITKPDGLVVIEVNRVRGVLYVHIEGFTCLRICQVEQFEVHMNSVVQPDSQVLTP